VAQEVENPAELDARRAAMGLEPYVDQLSRRKQLCHVQQPRTPRQLKPDDAGW
jgi:hypothetical protein